MLVLNNIINSLMTKFVSVCDQPTTAQTLILCSLACYLSGDMTIVNSNPFKGRLIYYKEGGGMKILNSN